MYPKAKWWHGRTRKPAYQRAYQTIAAQFPSSTLVLDIGCGNGELLKHLFYARKIRQAVGIDISPELIESAQQQLSQHNILVARHNQAKPAPGQHVSLVLGDYQQMNIPEGMYDAAIFAFPAIVSPKEVLEQGSYGEVTQRLLHAMLAKMSKSLKPGGVLVQVEYDAYPEGDAKAQAERVYSWVGLQHGLTTENVSFIADADIAADVDFQAEAAHKGYIIATHRKPL